MSQETLSSDTSNQELPEQPQQREVIAWFGEVALGRFIGSPEDAADRERLFARRFAGHLVTNKAVKIDERYTD